MTLGQVRRRRGKRTQMPRPIRHVGDSFPLIDAYVYAPAWTWTISLMMLAGVRSRRVVRLELLSCDWNGGGGSGLPKPNRQVSIPYMRIYCGLDRKKVLFDVVPNLLVTDCTAIIRQF